MAKSYVFRIALSLVLLSSVSYSSSVLFILSPASVVVGADSKTYDFAGRPLANACKILAVPSGIVFASAGPLSDGSKRFTDLASDALHDATTVSDAAARFDRLVQTRLERLATRMIEGSIEGKPWYQAAFASYTASGPQIALRIYRPVKTGSSVAVHIEPKDCLKDCAGMSVGLGYFSNMERALADGSVPTGPVAEGMKYLIGLEIAANPGKVGAPVAVLTVDGSGAHWLEHGECK